MKFRNIIVILAYPENPDNIGAVARAIKNMGFETLRLVIPPARWRVKGRKMAMSAGDILKKAQVFRSLKDAAADISVLVGTTRRHGKERGTFLAFDKAIEKIQRESPKGNVGIVFGCESKGLSNEHIRLCDYQMTIPTGRAYPSLNLAQAVMVVLFSISGKRSLLSQESKAEGKPLKKKEVELTLMCFEEALRSLGYREGGANLLPRILQTTRDLIKRSGLWEREAQMIKGLSRRITEKVNEFERHR